MLQGIRELLAQLLQSKYILLIIIKFRFQGSLFRERFLQSAQFCLHKLAFPDHLSLFRFRQASCLSAAVTLRLRHLHLLLIGGDGTLPLLLQFPDQGSGFLHPFILLQVADALVDMGDLCLVGLEVAVGLQIVEYGRHEVLPVASSANLSAVGSQITPFRVTGIFFYIFYDEHAKHFAARNLFLPVFSSGKNLLYFPACLDAERMRFVIQRIVHPCRNIF